MVHVGLTVLVRLLQYHFEVSYSAYVTVHEERGSEASHFRLCIFS